MAPLRPHLLQPSGRRATTTRTCGKGPKEQTQKQIGQLTDLANSENKKSNPQRSPRPCGQDTLCRQSESLYKQMRQHHSQAVRAQEHREQSASAMHQTEYSKCKAILLVGKMFSGQRTGSYFWKITILKSLFIDNCCNRLPSDTEARSWILPPSPGLSMPLLGGQEHWQIRTRLITRLTMAYLGVSLGSIRLSCAKRRALKTFEIKHDESVSHQLVMHKCVSNLNPKAQLAALQQVIW